MQLPYFTLSSDRDFDRHSSDIYDTEQGARHEADFARKGLQHAWIHFVFTVAVVSQVVSKSRARKTRRCR
jgi:hypothetical protein